MLGIRVSPEKDQAGCIKGKGLLVLMLHYENNLQAGKTLASNSINHTEEKRKEMEVGKTKLHLHPLA